MNEPTTNSLWALFPGGRTSAGDPPEMKEPLSVGAGSSPEEQETTVIENVPTSPSPVNDTAVGFGATRTDWMTFTFGLGLDEDLLPVVSNLGAVIAPRSKLKQKDIGKVPSEYNGRQRQVRGIEKWTTKRATPQEIAAWMKQPDYGICIQTRVVRGLDVDITDASLAARVRALIQEKLGTKLPVRMRANSSKFLVMVETPGEIKKDRFTVSEDGRQAIELLGNGQQFIAAGTHPSGARYEWEGGVPALVPQVSIAVLSDLWAELRSEFAVDKQSAPRVVADVTGGPLDDSERQLDIDRCNDETMNELESASHYVPVDSDDDWIWFLYAMSSLKCTRHEDRAREIWTSRIQSSSENKPGDENRWDTVTSNAILYTSVFHRAAKNGWKNPRKAELESERERSMRIAREGSHSAPTQRILTGSEMLESCVYIADGARVASLDEPRFSLPFGEFKHFTAGSVEVSRPNGPKGQPKKTLRADLWLANPERKTVRTQTFAPGKGRVCLSPEGDESLNLWVPRTGQAPSNWRDLYQVFADHVEYLVPLQAERERFLDWLAHIEQRPGELPHTHYLLVAKQTGIGRNWLAYALARVFAGYVALGFDLGEALRSGFNGALSQRLIAVVDELHEGGPGGANKPLAEKLKSMLTEQTRRVNPKYGRQHVEFNCCRFLMFSNHEAALPLAENDRRVVVIENPSQQRAPDYYARLYHLLDDPALGAAIAEGLKSRDISAFNPGERAPMNVAKSRTIRAGRSEVEQAVRDLAADWPSDCITAACLQASVSNALGGKVGSTAAACVAAGLVKHDGRVRVAGVNSHVWILRKRDEWSCAAPAAIAAEVLRGDQSGFE